MGRHNQAALASPTAFRSFQRFVEVEQDLLTMLQHRLEQDHQMLAVMGVGRT
jgi:hypothetical protein